MVKLFRVLLLFLAVCGMDCSLDASDDTRVDVQLERNENFEDQPIYLLLNVQHDKKDPVDPKSLRLENTPLALEYVRDVSLGSDSPLTLSFYRFVLPGKKGGQYVLPPLSLKVGNREYHSLSVNYRILPAEKHPHSTYTPYLRLETVVEGKTPLYVGQKIRVGYRLYFNDNFDLDEMVLPLLEAKGFRKVGKERMNEINELKISARQIDQDIQALKPGTFSYGPSYLMGSIYRTNIIGQKQLAFKNIKAEAPTISIVVLDFPQRGQPHIFTGTVGENISFETVLPQGSSYYSGDKITLNLEFSSPQELSEIKLPDLCCQPGFPGIFQVDDIPAIPNREGNKLIYPVNLRIISRNTDSIPSIEFAYFNPRSEGYEIKKSKPIPIHVNSSHQKKPELALAAPVIWPESSNKVSGPELKSAASLEMKDLKNSYFGSWRSFLIVPFAGFYLLFQLYLFSYRKKMASKVSRSTFFFEQARAALEDSPLFYDLLFKSLLWRLKEVGLIPEALQNIYLLHVEGVVGEVREFLLDIDSKRFTGQHPSNKQQLLHAAKQLLAKIKGAEQ